MDRSKAGILVLFDEIPCFPSQTASVNQSLLKALNLTGARLHLTVPYFEKDIPPQLCELMPQIDLIGSNDSIVKPGNTFAIRTAWKDRYKRLKTLQGITAILTYPRTLKTATELQKIHKCRLVIVADDNVEVKSDPSFLYYALGPKLARDMRAGDNFVIPWQFQQYGVTPQPYRQSTPHSSTNTNKIVVTFWPKGVKQLGQCEDFTISIKAIGQVFQQIYQNHNANLAVWYILYNSKHDLADKDLKATHRRIKDQGGFPGINVEFVDTRTLRDVESYLTKSELYMNPLQSSALDMHILQAIQLKVPVLVHHLSGCGELLGKQHFSQFGSVVHGHSAEEWKAAIMRKLIDVEKARNDAGGLRLNLESEAKQTMHNLVRNITGHYIPEGPSKPSQINCHTYIDYVDTLNINFNTTINVDRKETHHHTHHHEHQTAGTQGVPQNNRPSPEPTTTAYQPEQDPDPTQIHGSTDTGNILSQPHDAESLEEIGTVAEPMDISNQQSPCLINVRPPTDEDINIINQQKTSKYVMSRKPHAHGKAVIINMSKINRDGIAHDRKGSEQDVKRMVQLWAQLNFEVILYQDILSSKFLYTLKRLADDIDKNRSKHNALVLVLMGHGEENVLLTADNKSVRIKDIINIFSNENCQGLIDKPKMFFIQACRGAVEDKAIEADAPGFVEADSDKEIKRTVTSSSDVFVAYATHLGFKAWRNIHEGSWFIHTIANIFSHHAKHNSLTQLMHKVTDDVSNKGLAEEAKFMMCPICESSLKKDVFFLLDN